MPYRSKVAGYNSSLSDGWTTTSSGCCTYMWENRLAGGFWDVYNEIQVSGDVAGVGYISGDIDYYILYAISGDIAGVGYIFSDVQAREAVRISGAVAGIGYIGSKMNFSRQRSVYPELRVDSTYSASDCPIAAFEYIGFSPNKVLDTISYEDDVYENTRDYYITETINNSDGVYPITHYPFVSDLSGKIPFLVTNYISNGIAKPLFYQYELLYDAYSTENAETITLYKNNEIVVNKEEYIIEFSYDLLNDGNSRYEYFSSDLWGEFKSTESVHRVRILVPVAFSDPGDFYTVSYNKSVYGARTPQRELVELRSIYKENEDYIVTSSGLVLPGISKISSDSLSLYIVKDPDYRIKPIGVEPPVYQPDEISSWRLRLNPGSILINSGLYNGTTKRSYLLENLYASDNIPITNVKPIAVYDNILRLRESPIYVDPTKYVHPLYEIELYDKKDLVLIDDLGKMSVEVNGVARTDIRIKSIDRHKGYLMLDTTLQQTDEIELNFYVEQSGYMVVDNLELNPKVIAGDSLFHISGYFDGLGIALRPYDSGNLDTHYPYLYDASLPETDRNYKMIPEIGEATETGYFENMLPICELNINRLSTDMVKVTDARTIGGGIDDEVDLDDWMVNATGLNIREKGWYTNKGYYGGEPLSMASNIVIHVPSGVLFSGRQRWIDSLSGIHPDPREAYNRGTREYNFYLDQVIRRYISAGSDYILIPIDSSGNFMDIVTLDY